MYEAKREGGGCVIAFTNDMRARRHERLSLESRLRDAVEQRRIGAAFQPVVDARTGALYAVEALARWRDEERGDVPPSRFIELAEAVGLVARIDLAILAQGLECLRSLASVAPDCRLQFNLSPRSIDRPGIVDAILEACHRARIAPARVTVEVTESAFASEAATPLLVLSSLRSHGFGIALDDFGVGHSSFSRLAKFAPDTLKIDGQFVRDLEGPGGHIVAAVVALARQFRIRTTAEFVETDAQWRRLAEHGCDCLQGYGVGVPMSGDALAAWLRSRAQPSSRGPGIGSAMP
jgi:EAL domain-containing protein (putative c-di-GMP-specific phosphodiesterase class I)